MASKTSSRNPRRRGARAPRASSPAPAPGFTPYERGWLDELAALAKQAKKQASLAQLRQVALQAIETDEEAFQARRRSLAVRREEAASEGGRRIGAIARGLMSGRIMPDDAADGVPRWLRSARMIAAGAALLRHPDQASWTLEQRAIEEERERCFGRRKAVADLVFAKSDAPADTSFAANERVIRARPEFIRLRDQLAGADPFVDETLSDIVRRIAYLEHRAFLRAKDEPVGRGPTAGDPLLDAIAAKLWPRRGARVEPKLSERAIYEGLKILPQVVNIEPVGHEDPEAELKALRERVRRRRNRSDAALYRR